MPYQRSRGRRQPGGSAEPPASSQGCPPGVGWRARFPLGLCGTDEGNVRCHSQLPPCSCGGVRLASPLSPFSAAQSPIHGLDRSQLRVGGSADRMVSRLLCVPGLQKLYILGGEVAESAQKCTHLIASKVTRTVKFLTAISVVKHIVTPEWLEECFKCQKFIGEGPRRASRTGHPFRRGLP